MGAKFWIAIPQTSVSQGELLYFTNSMEMKDFYSQTLDRTFESVLFVERVEKQMGEMDIQSPHSGIKQKKPGVSVESAGDLTVEKVYAQKNSLNGKTVKLRGEVVKFNPEILDRNWIHIQDGTGSQEDYDLLVTSSDYVDVGDIVIIEGTVATDKDFGHGYSYSIVVEEAKVTVEHKKTKI
jgi:hypothetical protein